MLGWHHLATHRQPLLLESPFCLFRGKRFQSLYLTPPVVMLCTGCHRVSQCAKVWFRYFSLIKCFAVIFVSFYLCISVLISQLGAIPHYHTLINICKIQGRSRNDGWRNPESLVNSSFFSPLS